MQIFTYLSETIGVLAGTVQNAAILIDETVDHARTANNETWGMLNDSLKDAREEQQEERKFRKAEFAKLTAAEKRQATRARRLTKA